MDIKMKVFGGKYRLQDGLMREDLVLWSLVMVTAFLFVTIFSYTTSPLYGEWGNTPDSPIFQIIGKYWERSWIPYVDLWDMKGPFIFFMNATGYALTDNKTGVWIVQVVWLFLTLLAVCAVFRLYFSRKKSLFFTLFSLAGLSYVYEGGNLTEEYLLPLLAFSFYLLVKWIDCFERNGNPQHNPIHATVYGLTFGLALMSRLTNALGLCAAVMVVAVVLIRRRQYLHLVQNALSFLLGACVAIVPFLYYFAAHHALLDMWHATFTYAFDYAIHSSKDIRSSGVHHLLLSYANSFFLMMVAILMFFRHQARCVRPWLWLAAATVPLVWFLQGNGFSHYGMTVFPLFAIAMVELDRLALSKWQLAVVLLLMVGCASKLRFVYKMYQWENPKVAACRSLLRQVPEVDYSSFVAYNCTPYLYLDLNVRPAVPLFALQDLGMERIPDWHEFVMETFHRNRAKWILVFREEDVPVGIQSILDEKYERFSFDRHNHLELYKIR